MLFSVNHKIGLVRYMLCKMFLYHHIKSIISGWGILAGDRSSPAIQMTIVFLSSLYDCAGIA